MCNNVYYLNNEFFIIIICEGVLRIYFGSMVSMYTTSRHIILDPYALLLVSEQVSVRQSVSQTIYSTGGLCLKSSITSAVMM